MIMQPKLNPSRLSLEDTLARLVNIRDDLKTRFDRATDADDRQQMLEGLVAIDAAERYLREYSSLAQAVMRASELVRQGV